MFCVCIFCNGVLEWDDGSKKKKNGKKYLFCVPYWLFVYILRYSLIRYLSHTTCLCKNGMKEIANFLVLLFVDFVRGPSFLCLLLLLLMLLLNVFDERIYRVTCLSLLLPIFMWNSSKHESKVSLMFLVRNLMDKYLIVAWCVFNQKRFSCNELSKFCKLRKFLPIRFLSAR